MQFAYVTWIWPVCFVAIIIAVVFVAVYCVKKYRQRKKHRSELDKMKLNDL